MYLYWVKCATSTTKRKLYKPKISHLPRMPSDQIGVKGRLEIWKPTANSTETRDFLKILDIFSHCFYRVVDIRKFRMVNTAYVPENLLRKSYDQRTTALLSSVRKYGDRSTQERSLSISRVECGWMTWFRCWNTFHCFSSCVRIPSDAH